MPTGAAGAAKVGANQGGGGGFQPRPKGINFFTLPQDGQEAQVRFLQPHEQIAWVRKWKLAPSGIFQYGELVNAVDQHEDGTPDPGYAANLKKSFKAYPTMIWFNAPTYQKNPDGSLFKDNAGNKVHTGFAHTVSVWECSYEVYSTLQELDAQYRGLMSVIWRVKRQGLKTNTKYIISPMDPYNLDQPFTQEEQQIAMSQPIDISGFVKIPTYDELATYLNGGVAPAQQPGFEQQADANQFGQQGPNPFGGGAPAQPPAPPQFGAGQPGAQFAPQPLAPPVAPAPQAPIPGHPGGLQEFAPQQTQYTQPHQPSPMPPQQFAGQPMAQPAPVQPQQHMAPPQNFAQQAPPAPQAPNMPPQQQFQPPQPPQFGQPVAPPQPQFPGAPAPDSNNPGQNPFN